ncbi:MAG: ABC transporter ATP-binding protein, partial [Thermoprotei archaeon]
MVRLEVKGVSFSYDSTPVLEDVSLTVKGGEILSIIGPNGSGKSTLLRCIDRMLRPRLGTILVDGKDINALSRGEVARKIGLVPQSERAHFPMSVFEMVLMGRRPYVDWSPSSRDLKIVSDKIEALGL